MLDKLLEYGLIAAGLAAVTLTVIGFLLVTLFYRESRMTAHLMYPTRQRAASSKARKKSTPDRR